MNVVANYECTAIGLEFNGFSDIEDWSRLESSLERPGDRIYAQLGMCADRPSNEQPDSFQAFARLGLPMENERLLDRLLCRPTQLEDADLEYTEYIDTDFIFDFFIDTDVIFDVLEAFQTCPTWRPERNSPQPRPRPEEQITGLDDLSTVLRPRLDGQPASYSYECGSQNPTINGLWILSKDTMARSKKTAWGLWTMGHSALKPLSSLTGMFRTMSSTFIRL